MMPRQFHVATLWQSTQNPPYINEEAVFTFPSPFTAMWSHIFITQLWEILKKMKNDLSVHQDINFSWINNANAQLCLFECSETLILFYNMTCHSSTGVAVALTAFHLDWIAFWMWYYACCNANLNEQRVSPSSRCWVSSCPTCWAELRNSPSSSLTGPRRRHMACPSSSPSPDTLNASMS